MTRKRTPSDYALWAALPMAHTSKVEGRITMILDTTRRRTFPRRAFVLGIALAAAAVFPLAMLRPAAEAQGTPASAQAQPRGNTPVQILGVTDAVLPGGTWWSESGKALLMPVYGVSQWGIREETTVKSGQKALFIAFHLRKPLQNVPVIYEVGGTTLDGITRTTLDGKYTTTMRSLQMQATRSLLLYGAAFPLSLAKTDVQVGVATGFGAETVNCPKTTGKTRFQRPSGAVIFTLIPNPHHLPAAQAARGNAVFMVSDHFRSPSPLKADNPLQVALHDGGNYERAVYALDGAGRVVTKLNVLPQAWPDASSKTADYSLMKTEQLTYIPNSLLKRIASFRLVARPYQWTQFKDVALQPSR